MLTISIRRRSSLALASASIAAFVSSRLLTPSLAVASSEAIAFLSTWAQDSSALPSSTCTSREDNRSARRSAAPFVKKSVTKLLIIVHQTIRPSDHHSTTIRQSDNQTTKRPRITTIGTYSRVWINQVRLPILLVVS